MAYPDKVLMWSAGIAHATSFCEINMLPVPSFVRVTPDNWLVKFCAYYRMNPEGNGKVAGCLERMRHIGTAGPA